MMLSHNEWSKAAAVVIYEAYPDHDLLPIEPPRDGETIGEFAARAEEAGDTLFLFLCREADDDIDAHEYVGRLDRAIRDTQEVQQAFRDDAPPGSVDGVVSSSAKPTDAGTPKKDVTVRLTLDRNWIELALSYADAKGRRSGSVSSSLHTADENAERFNAAIDAVESMVLAHACAGIDVTDPRYVEGIRTCVEACANSS
jgi:hypothetical protein